MKEFRTELEQLINKYSRENPSDTPDFILAEFLTDCLIAFDKTVIAREKWYGKSKADYTLHEFLQHKKTPSEEKNE